MNGRSRGLIALAILVGAGAIAGVIYLTGDQEPAPLPATTPATTDSPTATSTAGATGTTSPLAECSASDLTPLPFAQEGVPAPVGLVRESIVVLAVACDYDGLAELALRGPSGFTYSFGAGGDPATHWRTLEEEGREEVMRILVETLNLSYCTSKVGNRLLYQWPAAFCENPTDKEWNEVATLYSKKEIARMKQFGGFIGYRVGITERGDWQFFVAGD